MTKHCIICGAAFKSPPSDKKVTCSPACRSARCSLQRSGKPHPKSEAVRKAMAADPKVQERMKKFQPIGTAAAMALPESQRGPQNRTSKVWELIDPEGNHIIVKNLLDWARKNYTLFEPKTADPDEAANRIRCGFQAISCSMRGVKSRQRQVGTYKGWSLAALPTKEDEK